MIKLIMGYKSYSMVQCTVKQVMLIYIHYKLICISIVSYGLNQHPQKKFTGVNRTFSMSMMTIIYTVTVTGGGGGEDSYN